MIRRLFLFAALIFPQWAFAADSDGTLPKGFFTPPANDTSVYLLGKIFGVVGGVLSGDALIFGELFKVFNLAMLAIASIVLIYIIFVSTLNTCGEGEVLGRKWSSIFIPLRAVGAVALILPLGTTGYSVIQVFIMWVTIQGVGLADRLWDASIDFISRGGQVLNQDLTTTARADLGKMGESVAGEGARDDSGFFSARPATSSTAMDGMKAQSEQAGNMLGPVTCMIALQQHIKNQQEKLCSQGRYAGDQEYFCQPAPGFFNSVDIGSAVADANEQIKIQFPDIQGDPHGYGKLNGICGTMNWKVITEGRIEKAYTSNGVNMSKISDGVVTQAAFARVLAIQQMYLDMGNLAQAIVTNANREDTERFPLGKPDGNQWVSPESDKPPLFNGYELFNTAYSYHSIMRPTQNLLSNKLGDLARQVDVLYTARQQGWILAGSYFFELAGMQAVQTEFEKDSNGLEVIPGTLSIDSMSTNPTDAQQELINLNEKGFVDKGKLGNIECLIANDGPCNSNLFDNISVATYVNQAVPFGTGGGTTAYDTAKKGNPTLGALAGRTSLNIGKQTFKGGVFNMMGSMGSLLFNMILLPLVNQLAEMAINFATPAYMVVKAAMGIWIILWAGMIDQILNQTINPVLGVTLVGQMLLEQAVTIWETAMAVFIMTNAIAPLATAGMTVMAFVAPILLAMLTMLFGAGLFLGYYIPLIPYIFFILGGVAWMMSVVEAMVAAPLAALGVMHPEGHEIFGKAGDSAIPLLFNLFLRPAMMVIGFVGSILVSYAAIQLLHFGFARTMETIMSMSLGGATDLIAGGIGTVPMALAPGSLNPMGGAKGVVNSFRGASVVQFFDIFSMTGIIKALALLGLYVMMHVILLEKAFSLIYILPDQVLRWVFAGFKDTWAQDTSQLSQRVGGMLQGAAHQVATSAFHGRPKFNDEKDGDGGGTGTLTHAPKAPPPKGATSTPPPASAEGTRPGLPGASGIESKN